MKQVERIKKMEDILDRGTDFLNKMGKMLEDYKELQKDIVLLDKYYGSEDWYKDREDYDNKIIDNKVKAGVLAEDLVYDLLINNHEIAISMLELGTSIMKRESK